MAKANAENTKEATKRQPPPRAELPKYNVSHLADDLKIDASAVRVLLRKSNLTKEGAAWGWEKKSDYDAALKELKSLQAAPAKETKAPAKEAPKAADKKAPAKGKAKA